MESKILGVPLALILFVVLLAVLVDVPMVLLNQKLQQEIGTVRTAQVNSEVSVQKVLVTPTGEPTATPSAVLTAPTRVLRTVVTPAVTTQVK